MAHSSPLRRKQIRLTMFNNEPMARLAEQRLRQMGIPCFIRSLRGGPGLWGSAYNLPHDLLVYESDETQARQVLELEPRQPSDGEGSNDQRPFRLEPGSGSSRRRFGVNTLANHGFGPVPIVGVGYEQSPSISKTSPAS